MLMDLNVNITVSLSEATLNVLRQFAPDMPEKVCDCPAHQDLKIFIQETVVEFLEGLKKHTEKPAENAAPEKEAETVREEKEAQALQQAPAAAAPAEISDASLRQATKAAKDKVGADAIRALFQEFEIPNSTACPQERRSELMGRLNKLAA